MNTFEFTYLLNKPNAIKDKHTAGLEKIVNEFPFFQSARALLLKGLHNQESFQYNPALRKTAAYTTDRSVLFDFITSGDFLPVQKLFIDEKEAFINDIMVHDLQIVTVAPTVAKDLVAPSTLEQSIVSSINAVQEEEEIAPTSEEKAAQVSEKLEIGKPLDFSKEEKHSFQEWLQLANFNPIEREKTPDKAKTKLPDPIIDPEKKKKIALIDRFIETNPKISPVREMSKIAHIPEQNQDQSYLMTETLAKVYLEQRKFQKAIQAYEILILKYPEKSTFFANRISDIRVLQQNNN